MGLQGIIVATILEEYQLASSRLEASRNEVNNLFFSILKDWIAYHKQTRDDSQNPCYIPNDEANSEAMMQLISKYVDPSKFENVEIDTNDEIQVFLLRPFLVSVVNNNSTERGLWIDNNKDLLMDLKQSLLDSQLPNVLIWSYLLFLFHEKIYHKLDNSSKNELLEAIEEQTVLMDDKEVYLITNTVLTNFRILQDINAIIERFEATEKILEGFEQLPAYAYYFYSYAMVIQRFTFNNISKAQEYVTKAIEISRRTNNPEYLTNDIQFQRIITTDPMAQIDIISRELDYFNNLENKYFYIRLLSDLANIYKKVNQFDQSAEIWTEILDLGKVKYQDKSNLVQLVQAHAFFGRHDKVVDLIEADLSNDFANRILKNPDYVMIYLNSLKCIGDTQRYLPIVDQILSVMKDAQNITGAREYMVVLKAEYYSERAEFEQAIKVVKPLYLELKADLKPIMLDSYISTIISMLSINYYSGNISEAETYFSELSQMEEENRLPLLYHRLKVIWEAKLLKAKNNVRDLAQALTIMEHLIEKEPWGILERIELIDLYIAEASLYNNTDKLYLTLPKLEEIAETARKKYSHDKEIQALLLKARVYVTLGKFSEAEAELSRLETKAENYGILYLKEQIVEELKKMQLKFREYKSILKQNPELDQRISKMDLMDYVKKARALLG